AAAARVGGSRHHSPQGVPAGAAQGGVFADAVGPDARAGDRRPAYLGGNARTKCQSQIISRSATAGWGDSIQFVRILLPISGRLIRSRSPRPLSAKTYENPARVKVCR